VSETGPTPVKLSLRTATLGPTGPPHSAPTLSGHDRSVLRVKMLGSWQVLLAAAALLVLGVGTVVYQSLSGPPSAKASHPHRLTRAGLLSLPLMQLGEKLTGGGETGKGKFGSSVAMSGDGNTALVAGISYNSVRAAWVFAGWVFTRSGSTWTQQGEKLTLPGEAAEGVLNRTVALSDDGNTALIGSYEDNSGVGAAWVFTRSGSTWTQQGEKLTGSGESGTGSFGDSVALSSDGDTALIGGYGDNSGGAVWVFTRSGSTWTQQGEKLTASGESEAGAFGFSVALSSDGNTALIGGFADNSGGAAWVFTRSGSTWTQQGEKLTASREIGPGAFGWSVALSGDGNTAVIGGFDDNSVGAVWVFTRSGSTWTQQGEKLTASNEVGGAGFGRSVALSSDGNTALIGGPADNLDLGAAWVFTRSGSTWTQQGEKLTGSGEVAGAGFGSSVALSRDGNSALIGGPYDNGDVGATWVSTSQSGPPPPPPPSGIPLNTSLPAITGNPVVGQTLSCSHGTWTGGTPVSYAYQWQHDRGSVDISGATGATYTVTASDQGYGLVCQVTAINYAGSASAASMPATVPLSCQGPASSGNAFVQGIEVTQAVQTIQFPDTAEGCYGSPLDSQSHPGALYPSGAWRNSDGTARYVELVQGHSIVVRVFAATYGSSPTAPVAAQLYVFRNGRRITSTPLSPDAGRRALSHGLPFDVPLLFDVPYYAERIDPAGAYEFDIPGSWAYGNLTLVARLNPADVPPALPECSGCAVDDVFTLAQITFKKTRSVRIHPAAFTPTGGPIGGFPTPSSVFSQEPLVLPVADGQLLVPSQYEGFIGFNNLAGDNLSLYQGVEFWCCFNGAPTLSPNPIDDYVGVLANGSFGGQSIDGTPISAVNATRPLTSVGHELGHGFGLHHAGHCPNDTNDPSAWPLDNEGFLQGVGVDPAQIMPGGYYRLVASSNPLGEFAPVNEQVYDLMSYCVAYLGSSASTWEAGSWISPINWNRLVDALASGTSAIASRVSRHVLARGARVAHAATAGRRALRVLAQVTQSGTTIGLVEPSRAAASSGSSSAPYHLIARDKSGRVLADVGMQVEEGHTYMGPSFTLLSATVPAGGAQSIEITNAGKVVAQRTRSIHPPRVQILAPKPGATVGHCHSSSHCTVRLRWRTSNGPRSMLTFLDYSSDGGRHWRTIYLGPDSGSVALSATLFSHARHARIRVRVNDGFNETSATSGVFEATGHSPAVAIMSPTSGEHVASDASLYLSGSAQDDSGRSLSGKRLRWYIGRKLIGTGTEVITTKKLPSGTVRVRLVAHDSQGRRTSAAVVIHTFAAH
jgi:hypothetical protein